MIKFSLRNDTVSLDLRHRLKGVSPAARTMMLAAVADVLSETAKGAFSNAGMRPTPWPPKVDGSPATLRSIHPLLSRSPRRISASPQNAILGSDRPYAAPHQYGAPKAGLPPRPFFPFTPEGPTELAVKRGKEAIRVKMGIKR